MNLQVIASPAGDVLWVSGALPGSVAGWIWGILADKGCQGSTYANIPYKGKNKPQSQKDADRARPKLHSHSERANAQLKTCSRPGTSSASSAAALLLPLACRPARESHPRIADLQGKRSMKKAQ